MMMRRSPDRFLLGFLLLIFLILASDNISSTRGNVQHRPSADRWCFDYAHVLPADVEEEINDQGRSIKKAFDIDFVVAIVPDLGGQEISRYTVDMFSRWKIGASTQGKKGILILITKKEQKVRIEIGYDLEGIYPDAYVGQVEREILKEFLEQAEWGVGFLSTIENFVFRIYNKNQREEVKNITGPDKDLEYYSQGAGAQNVFDFGAALQRPLPDNYDDIRAYFSAQPTQELAFQRYMELCAKGVKHNNDLTLFTDLSNQFWRGWKHTSGQQKAEAQEVSGRPYNIKVKENHAVVFFPAESAEKVKKSPLYFLFKSEEGWQVDIATMTRCLRVVGPGWMMMTDIFHPYSAIIMEEYNLVKGFLSPWDDSVGVNPIYALGSGLYNEQEPGFHIGVWESVKAKSHLKRGDSLLAVNGTKIRDWPHLMSFFEGFSAGTRYQIELLRDGRRMTVNETLGGSADGFALYRPCLKTPRRWLGVYMVQSLDSEWNVTRQMRDQGKFQYSSLCEIIDIYPGSPADRAGLKVRDLIVDYGTPDDNAEIMPWDVVEHLYATRPGESMEFTIVRNLSKVIKIKVAPEETMHKGYF